MLQLPPLPHWYLFLAYKSVFLLFNGGMVMGAAHHLDSHLGIVMGVLHKFSAATIVYS